MSFRAASTPIGEPVALLRPGNTNTISPISMTSNSSSLKRRAKKRQASPLPARKKIHRITSEKSDGIRKAPRIISDIWSIIGEPLYPVPHLVDLKDAAENFDTNVEYVPVPELEITPHTHDNEENEEFTVLRPLRTYKGTGPRRWKKRFDDTLMREKSSTNAVPEFHFLSNSEAEQLWDKYLKKDAEIFANQQQALEKRTLRNREIMLQIRKEAAEQTAAPKPPQTRKKSEGKKTRDSKRLSSSEMIRLHGDFHGFIVMEPVNPFDPHFQV